MPILNENTEHAFFCEGPSMTEQEHAERCDINYQLDRIRRGLQPNWSASKEPIYSGDQIVKMDNSLTDHRIALQEQFKKVAESDLSELSEEQFLQLPPQLQKLVEKKYRAQKAEQKAKNDEKLKNDENAKKEAERKRAEYIEDTTKAFRKAKSNSDLS